MCGRFSLKPDESKEIWDIVRALEEKHKAIKTGEIYPSNDVPVIYSPDSDDIDYDAMTWGFHGFKKGQLLINARSETVTEKKTFAKAFKGSRCVFPTTGFYEWDANKEKFLFTEQDSKAVYLAGFYKRFEDGNRSIILTTAANESMQQVHDRMPVILPKGLINQWILDEEFAESFIKQGMPQLVSQRR